MPPNNEIGFAPPGYRHIIVLASYIKRVLVTQPMTASERLQFLERLNGLVDEYFIAPALAAIQPVCDTGAAMIHEALKLDRGPEPQRCDQSFKMLTGEEVFDHLLQLNPSIGEAIRICERRRLPTTLARAPAAAEGRAANAEWDYYQRPVQFGGGAPARGSAGHPDGEEMDPFTGR
jgi:hypothetical protein